MEIKKKIILTGDRPTGPLHLGHFFGSLKNRVTLQDFYQQFVIIADVQALAAYASEPGIVRENVLQVCLDYLAVGIDPAVSTIFIQSLIPEIAELTIFYLNFVTLARLQRNPTVKEEINQKGFGAQIPAGFLMHPINQAADITAFGAHLVPVGEDQLPLIEQTVEIVRAFNRIYTPVLIEPEAMIATHGSRVIGIDGKAKMSKSLGNAIFLSDEPDVITKKVMSMYTDPSHIHVSSPGKIEGNVVFMYLDLFEQDHDLIAELKAHYQRGGLGDVVLKKRVNDLIQSFLKPIRERRKQYAADVATIWTMLMKGSDRARTVAHQTLQKVRQAMRLDYF